ncbi:MAG: DUF3175 domain-containing protein [Xanthobacteraceae bacterium]|jgi:hypothetical protein
MAMAGKAAKARKSTRRTKAPTTGRIKAHGGPRRRAGRGIKRWSQRVTRESNALDLKSRVFTLASPRAIALSLKRSALASRRRKADPYRSALSMLTFYVNRAGRNLPAARRRKLERAKGELRAVFGKEPRSA